MIKLFNLPIHVHALHLDEGEEEMRDRCGWHDLQEEYAHQRLLLIGTARDIRAQLNTGKEFREKYNTIPIKELDETIAEKADFIIFDRIAESLPECLSDLDWEKFQEAYRELLQMLFEYVFFRLKISPKTNERTRNQIAQNFYQTLLMSINPLLNRLVDLFFFPKNPKTVPLLPPSGKVKSKQPAIFGFFEDRAWHKPRGGKLPRRNFHSALSSEIRANCRGLFHPSSDLSL